MIVQISDDLFWGFKVDIDNDSFSNDEDITKHVLNTLEAELTKLGLIALVEQMKKKNFHIHCREENNITYLCSHS